MFIKLLTMYNLFNDLMNNIIILYYIMNNDLENKILINKEGHNESTLIDIESNCCNFNNNQRNTRRKIINISIILMNLITLAGIITLLIKK